MDKPAVEPIAAGDPLARSADLVAENIAQLKALFPELITEGEQGASVNVDVLKQLVGDKTLTDADEKYGLNWFGKRNARRLALTPSTGTLRPAPDESVDWDTTQNLMIEGDNLEVLKLLQKSYAGKVKLIYIDPPYNTGKDFVYPDNYQDSIKNYLELTGQVEGGAKISSNTEASGRFHTDWLNMMYPRLKLARNLLREDGALFISIDDGEFANLVELCCEVFGEEAFVGGLSVLINPRGRHLDKYIAKTHDNIIVVVKDADIADSIMGMEKAGAMLEDYDKEDARGRYRELGLRNRNQAFNPLTRPNLYFPLYVDPRSGEVSQERDDTFSQEVLPVTADGIKTCWTWSREKVRVERSFLTASQTTDGSWRIFRKDYLENEDGEVAATLAKSLWLEKEFNNDYGRKAVKELFASSVMDFPKSPHLIQRIVEIGCGRSGIVMDFFAGSGTTGQAVLAQSALDKVGRKYILVQFPEPLNAQIAEQTIAAEFCIGINKPCNISELTKERLRRAGAKIKAENPGWHGDTGFRVYKLDSSNIRPWQSSGDLEKDLVENVEHIVPDRSEDDVLTELLLKLGLDLCVPIEGKVIAGKTVHSIGGGVLMACLDASIAEADAEPLALGIAQWHAVLAPVGDTTCVFRDSAFRSDVAKTNLAAILDQHGIAQVRSL